MSVYRTIGPTLVEIIIFCFVVAILDLVHDVEAILYSVTLVALARFCSNFHQTLIIKHCMFYRKIGAKGSVLQELCHFVIFFCDHFFKVLLCTFSSSCQISLKFSLHLNHQTLPVL